MVDRDETFATRYRAARCRKRGAAEELLRPYQSDLGAYIRRRLGWRARGIWEDARQETMIAVLARLDSYPQDLSESAFRSFLFQTAKRKVADCLRREPMRQPGAPDTSAELDAPADAMGPATQARMRDEYRRIRERILTLRTIHASILRCIVLEHRSLRETAQVLGLSEDAARKRLQRAGEELSRLLGGDPPEMLFQP